MDSLTATLKARPSLVRLAYAPGTDPPDLVKHRLAEIRDLIERAWKTEKGRYALTIEVEGGQP